MSGLSRRSFLLGAGAMVAAGATAVGYEERDRLRRWGHAAGVIDGPDRAIPKVDADPQYDAMPSSAMRHPVRFGLYEPSARPVAVVVCLHGKGNDERMAFDGVGVHRFVAARGLPFAVAAVDGGEDSYWHARADGTDAGRMVTEEFIPFVRQRTGASRTVLMGWSMGGFGALLLAARHPDQIATAVVGSPALWTRAADTAPGAFDDAADFNRNNVLALVDGLRSVPVRVDCGGQDPFVPGVRAFARALPAATVSFGPGYHDDGFWRSVVPDQLDFIAKHLV